MDDPSLDAEAHRAALRGLARINHLSGAAFSLWREIKAEIDLSPDSSAKPPSVLDVATGAGDLPLRIARLALARGISFRWTLCDISPRAVESAAGAMRAAGFVCDAAAVDITRDMPLGRFDIVVCSLFLHHLDPPDVRTALCTMASMAGRALLVRDLRRSRAGLALAGSVPRLLTRSPVVWRDASASVRAAYTIPELSALARDAGLDGAAVRPIWPVRMALRWRPT